MLSYRREPAIPVFAVVTARGPNWDHARGIREQRYWAEHGAFMDGLVDAGTVILGGPVGGYPDPDVIALLAVNAADDDELVSAFDADPWIEQQILRLKERWPWTIWLDGRGRG